ncbi:MAG: hypothetical protein H8D54_04460, partial [Candidatus Omnitrophica bacterium]|nr:hypothetical protein [Candidatus Omnitrophota bacterium]
MATILLLASGRLADRWQNPLARMEVRSPKSKEGIIIKVSPQEGNAKYFTLTVDAEGKVQIAKAKAIDFTGERIAEIGQMSTVAEVEIDKDRGKGSPLDLLKYLVENGYYEGNSISRGDLIEARGFSPEAVRLEINSLIAIGLLERTSTGRYSLTRRLTSREIDAIQRYAIGIINKRGLKGEKLGLDRWRLDDLGEEKIGAIAEFVRPTTLAGALEKVAQTYGLSLDSVSFTQVSGPVDDALGDPIENETVTASLHATNLTTLSSHFTAGCAIEALSEGRTADARAIKMVADGGAVTVLEKTLKAMAEDLDITLIIGGSEGKTRDGSPALTVKEVINPNGKNGIYIVHSDPIENTNSHAEDKPGAWVLFFLTRLPATYEVLLREDASSAGVGLQDFLEQRTGEDLAKYNIPFCHDRYVISVSYPGNAGAVKRAQFHPTDDPREILEKIADEHDISLEELGRRAHIVFLERERHDYKKEALDILREDGNQITYSTVTDGDAFARILAPLGMPTHEEKRWTIVLGGSGAIEGFATGLVTAGKVNKDGSLVGRVNMVHSAVPHKASAEYKPGQPLAGWDDYQEKDLRDFDSLGITDPAHVITDEEISEQYPESMVVAAAITGARENIDISSDLSIPRVTADGEYIEVSSFVIDEHGRSFLVTTRYKSSDPSYTRLSMRADNNYGFFDEESVDFAIQRLITAATDSERKTWEERLVDHLGPEQYVARLLALIEVGRDIDINFPVLNILNDLVALDEPLIVFIVKAALEMSEGKRKAFEAVFTDWKNEIPQETRDAYSVRLMESVIKGLEKWNDFFASVEGDTKRAMGLIHKTDKGFTSAGRNEPGSVTTTFPVEELNEVAPQNKVDLTATDEAGLVALMQPIERTHPYAPLRLVVALGEMLGGTGSRYQDSLREEPETIEEIE